MSLEVPASPALRFNRFSRVAKSPHGVCAFVLLTAGAISLASACNAADDAACGESPCGPRSETTSIPQEDVVVSNVAPPPISGGTLLVTKDGTIAVAADPDRDRIVVVDLEKHAVRNVIATTEGAEPGRSAEDAAGRVHVALRNAGKLVTIDRSSGAQIALTPVCPAPRGVAYDRVTDQLYVACAGGELVTLKPGAPSVVLRVVSLGDDLRDVVVRGDELVVSHFRNASVDVVDAKGVVESSTQPLAFPGTTPTVAWRTIAGPEGRVFVLHQRSQTEAVMTGAGVIPESVAVGSQTGAAYDGEGKCGAIVQSQISLMNADAGSIGKVMTGADLFGMVLPVDLAISPKGTKMAVLAAGTGFVIEGGPEPLVRGGADCGSHARPVAIDPEGPAVVREAGVRQMPTTASGPIAVAYGSHDELVVQSREPASLAIHNADTGAIQFTIALGGESRRDTGHELFHANPDGPTGALVCASCHPEGRDDGHTWLFSDSGFRRTQSLAGFSLATAPYHWNGDLADVGALMDQVFVHRMGNAAQTDARKEALTHWLTYIPAAPRALDDPSDGVRRGAALFEDASVGCSSCHSGPEFTNNATVDVGTGRALQVPSLLGVRARAPYMHDGCVKTLKDRFTNPCAGGDRHGHTSGLDPEQIDDLVRYLESL